MFNRVLVLLPLFFMFSVVKAETNLEITDFLNSVVQSFNSQDCVAYASHFTEPNRQKRRRDSGIYFASNNSTMSFKESHVLSETESSAEIAVAYSVKDSDYVSRIFLEKEDGEWRISKELIVKKESPYEMNYDLPQTTQTTQTTPRSNPFANTSLPAQQTRQNCPGGNCGGPQVPFGSLKACRDYGFDPIPCRNGSCSVK
jgi:hypothetical protein